MAMESLTTQDTNWAWPGNLDSITDVQSYAQHLVTQDFMKAPDAVKIFNGGGLPPGSYTDTTVTITSSNNPFRFYKVTDTDPNVCVFITTKNYTFNSPLSKDIKPFGDVGFVVMRKGGDGVIFRKQQATATNLVGVLPVNSTPIE
jgi:hypothetical protein